MLLRCLSRTALLLIVGWSAGSHAAAADAAPADLAKWQVTPESYVGATIESGCATLEAGKRNAPDGKQPVRWDFLVNPTEQENVTVAATVTIKQPAKDFCFFGEGWSVWPDLLYADQGFEAGILIRAGQRETAPRDLGYRVELSHKYQNVALVKYPDGGYLRVVPCVVKLNAPHRIEVAAQGPEIVVRVDGAEKIRFIDTIGPLVKGSVGIGTSSGAKVVFDDVQVGVPVASQPSDPAANSRPHTTRLALREWLGGRRWVFDGDEPILLLPVPKASYINNVKLRPGYKPLLSWNSHWDIANQGAFPDGTNTNSEVTVTGGGESLTAEWTGRQTKGRFETRTKLVISYDRGRSVYAYDVNSELEVLARRAVSVSLWLRLRASHAARSVPLAISRGAPRR